MGLFSKSKPQTAVVTVHGRAFACLVCQGGEFVQRSVLLNTPGFELFDFAWANQSSLGVICVTCGYLHEFLGHAVHMYDSGGGYPPGTIFANGA
jgi:hypothetical protein